jgi:protoporphyrinogen oxidase
VKGLSIRKVLQDACGKRLHLGRKRAVETSLIKRFWYPQYGPGQLWEKVAALVEEKGGIIRRQSPVVRIDWQAGAVRRVWTKEKDGSMQGHEAELFFSTMPIRHLIESMGEKVPATVRNVAKGLVYRDFITAGILVDRLKLRQAGGMIPDNWIYIQEKEVRLGRLQIFNNWSPYMAADKDKVWLGLEYFCQEGDALWQMPDDAFIHFAVNELAKIDIIEAQSVRDAVVIHVPKAYPAYFGTYGRLGEVRRFTDSLANLYLLGRNGQHRYNNMDHSMLTAMRAVDAVSRGSRDKTAVWSVNTEASYHETCGQEG